MSRARNWCFTSYKESQELFNSIGPNFEDGEIRYIIWGLEVCPRTKREHLQGYVEFKSSLRIRRVKDALGDPAVHLERRRGTQAEARAYCEKDGMFRSYGLPAESSQGSRNDLDNVRRIVSDGGGMGSVCDEATSWQALAGAARYLTYREVPRSRDAGLEVRWYWGKTGTGKTRAAFEEAERDFDTRDALWVSNDNFKWFDGYDAHQVVLFDDFRPDQVKLPWLLRLLDIYGCRVEVKGGFRQWKPERIYVTCPRPPAECYMDSGEEIEQLLRRITLIREF